MFAPRYSRIWEFEAFGSTASCPSSGIFGSADFRWLLVAYGGTTSCSCYSWVITLLSNMIPQKSLNFDSSVGEFNQTLQSKDFFLQVNQWTLETWAHSSPHRQYVNDEVLQFNTSPAPFAWHQARFPSMYTLNEHISGIRWSARQKRWSIQDFFRSFLSQNRPQF